MVHISHRHVSGASKLEKSSAEITAKKIPIVVGLRIVVVFIDYSMYVRSLYQNDTDILLKRGVCTYRVLTSRGCCHVPDRTEGPRDRVTTATATVPAAAAAAAWVLDRSVVAFAKDRYNNNVEHNDCLSH